MLLIKRLKTHCFIVVTFLFTLLHLPAMAEQPPYRVIISTDIGGTDPDDFQSMVHLLLYADVLDIEGLISSPYGPGRESDILKVIDFYEQDYRKLLSYSQKYPSPQQLRAITKQGETQVAPYRGYREATEGSNWIISRARIEDKRPLHLLVWGGIEDLAQALHDAPDIESKLRVYWIGGPNKKWSPDAYQYLVENHPDLWIIESNATYRGWFVGGEQDGQWGNSSFVEKHIAGHGKLGDFFNTQLGGRIKMGDTPSVAWLLNGDPSKPQLGGWGGQYVRAWARPHKVFHRLTNESDTIEEFGIFELVLPFENANKDSYANMNIGNQSLAGYIANDQVRFRFSPKAAQVFSYKIVSSDDALDGAKGGLTATATEPGQKIDRHLSHWWVDNPAPAVKEGKHIGAKTVNRWRIEYLQDFAQRMDRAQ